MGWQTFILKMSSKNFVFTCWLTRSDFYQLCHLDFKGVDQYPIPYHLCPNPSQLRPHPKPFDANFFIPFFHCLNFTTLVWLLQNWVKFYLEIF